MDPRSLEAAAKSGNMDLLYELIREDPYVLDKFDSIPFVDTPLHVAVVAGQTEFAMELMNLKPSFARKLNADGYTPLHLAVDHSHNWLVLQLLKLDPSLVRLKGRGGMTPLLLAVSGEKIDLISEFFLACPESIVDANVNGENALHIAAKNNNNQTEGVTVLKVIMGWILRLCQKDAEWTEKRVRNGRDKDGNTPLHLAAYEKDVSAIKSMLDNLSIINFNIQNKNGFTVLDIVVSEIQEHNRRYIESMIKSFGGKRSVSLDMVKTTSDILSSKLTCKESLRMIEIRNNNSRFSEERRNALLVVATLILTATYQTALQPPGGVSDSGGTTSGKKVGSVVMQEGQFIALWLWNSVGFYVAMLVTLRLMGLGHESKFWYFPLFLPLFVAYNVAGKVISPNSRAFTFGAVGACIVTIVWPIVVFLVEDPKDNRAKDRGPNSGLVWEGFTSLDKARGLVRKGYPVW